MPDRPLLEISDISMRVEAGDLAVLTCVPDAWDGIDAHGPRLQGDPIADWGDDIRLHAGMFVTSGHPSPVPGVRTSDVMHRLPSSDSAMQRRSLAAEWCERLDLDPGVIDRPLDADFTPGEGTSVEFLHLALLRPDVAVIDLTRTPSLPERRAAVAQGVSQVRSDQPDIAVVVVTNDDELIAGLTPDHVTTHTSPDVHVGQAHRDEKLP